MCSAGNGYPHRMKNLPGFHAVFFTLREYVVNFTHASTSYLDALTRRSISLSSSFMRSISSSDSVSGYYFRFVNVFLFMPKILAAFSKLYPLLMRHPSMTASRFLALSIKAGGFVILLTSTFV